MVPSVQGYLSEGGGMKKLLFYCVMLGCVFTQSSNCRLERLAGAPIEEDRNLITRTGGATAYESGICDAGEKE